MEKIVKSLLDGSFEKPLSECKLRQCGVKVPIIYEGPGLLTQKPDKSIVLRLFSEPVEISEAVGRDFCRDFTPGVLVPDSQYYDFEGRDHSGAVWKANRFSIEADFGSGTYIRARPRILEKTEKSSTPVSRSLIVAFLPGKIELPWHEVTQTGEGGSVVNRFERRAGRFEWKIVKTDDGAWLNFYGEESSVEKSFNFFLRGLSILIGRLVKPIFLLCREDDKYTTKIFNRLHESDVKKLLTPIGPNGLFAQDAHFFLQRFIESFEKNKKDTEQPCNLAYRYWHRILRAHQTDIENSSLVLSVAVEGLIKKTLISEADVDIDFVSQAKEAKPILEKSELGSRALACVLSSLENAKLPRVQHVLSRLVVEKFLSETHLKAWKKLRNAAAHGDILEDDERALQQHIDRFYVCLDLYYRLVFLLIGYEGKHVDYGKRGWPTSEFLKPAKGGVSEFLCSRR